MSLLINDRALYEEDGSLNKDLNDAYDESFEVKSKISIAYNKLNYKVKNKVERISVEELTTIMSDIKDLIDERESFLEKLNEADRKMLECLEAQSLLPGLDEVREDSLTLTEEVTLDEWLESIGANQPIPIDEPISPKEELANLLTSSGYDSSLVDGLSDEALSKYRYENNDTYVELFKQYSSIGKLNAKDINQILSAGNCSRFNQYSKEGLNLFFSSNPYSLPGQTTSMKKRFMHVNGRNYATCATGGCGPSTLNNISSVFYGRNTLSVVDTLKATYDNCHLNETDFSKLPLICADLGLSAENLPLHGKFIDYDDTAVIEAIDNGAMVMVSSKTKSGGGHYVAIVGYKENNNGRAIMLVLNPANSSGHDAQYSFWHEGVKINNGAYAITPLEGGIDIANNYHQQNENAYNQDKIAWEEKMGNDTILA